MNIEIEIYLVELHRHRTVPQLTPGFCGAQVRYISTFHKQFAQIKLLAYFWLHSVLFMGKQAVIYLSHQGSGCCFLADAVSIPCVPVVGDLYKQHAESK
jgi:hypothetical protein